MVDIRASPNHCGRCAAADQQINLAGNGIIQHRRLPTASGSTAQSQIHRRAARQTAGVSNQLIPTCAQRGVAYLNRRVAGQVESARHDHRTIVAICDGVQSITYSSTAQCQVACFGERVRAEINRAAGRRGQSAVDRAGGFQNQTLAGSQIESAAQTRHIKISTGENDLRRGGNRT